MSLLNLLLITYYKLFNIVFIFIYLLCTFIYIYYYYYLFMYIYILFLFYILFILFINPMISFKLYHHALQNGFMSVLFKRINFCYFNSNLKHYVCLKITFLFFIYFTNACSISNVYYHNGYNALVWFSVFRNISANPHIRRSSDRNVCVRRCRFLSR
jgi:hypothetical protein